MIIVELRIDNPIFKHALTAVPEMEITWERSDVTDGGTSHLLVWAEGGDFARFEDALSADPTVDSVDLVAEVYPRRLYKAALADSGFEASVYPLVVEEGGVVHELTATHDGWTSRVSFPGRSSLDRLYQFCRERDIDFEMRHVYAEISDEEQDEYGLTTDQRETLQHALKTGYLEIPREQSLDDLADDLDISQNAASERFRRAVQTLVANTVGPEDDEA
ncbi:helix-turn-helix domain-containing protein [Halorussus halophilus]|uniref:helix-turn-helix domain-containing protein n=1 Tax=Halorussus halophilus TaxID=2650975 RepID=UPI00130196C5|nr:helix-turn-helix domain-containing protein [Halorussus halophilus]